MLDSQALAILLPSLPLSPLQAVLYRAVTLEALYGFHRTPPYPAIRPLYNLGAPATGARYTPKGGMASLYLAEDAETAMAEVNPVYNKLRQQNPPIAVPLPPCVLFSVQVTLDTVLDITIETIQAALQTDTTELTGAWRRIQTNTPLPPTQRFGQAVFQNRQIQAIRYPSAQQAGHSCYVVFTDRLAGSSCIEVHDPDGNLCERLP